MSMLQSNAGGSYLPVNYATTVPPTGTGTTTNADGTAKANTDATNTDFNIIQQNAQANLANTYNQNMQSVINNLNQRGMFGSSVTNEDVGKVGQNYATALGTLAGSTAGQQVAQQNTTAAQTLAQQQLAQQGTQFNSTLANTAAEQLAQQKQVAAQLAQQQAQFAATLANTQAQQKATQANTDFTQEMNLALAKGKADPNNANWYLQSVLNKYQYL